MRAFLFFSILLFAVTACGYRHGDKLPVDMVKNPKTASGEDEGVKMPVIAFEKQTHDFGRLVMGEKVSYTFRFTNIGEADLIISHVSTNCGCTVPEYTKEPVKPGETGNLSVTFDSKNRKGFQNKTITVITNTQPNSSELNITAMVATPVQK
ncbi:MAG TPA: DUF1573 domain-containing protein [Bacteroidales bacterium]|nr:DUF1573 domain-containing protein [Bacteroidales bacterium]HOG67199.1 DUF1573 domain-containing protein [Bacteroidales bacterium]HPL12113.1 DUF1573 domain-containing protein [Bacteroidales bacterium]